MGFLKGAFVGGVIGGAAPALLVLALSIPRWRHDVLLVLFLTFLIGGCAGAGIGGVIGAVRKANRPPLLVRRRRRADAPEPAQDLRPRLTISALYALTAASVGTLLAIGLLGRGEVTRLVDALVPYDVTSLQARLMLSGTLLVGAYAVIAGLSLRAGPPGARERGVIAGAGFLTGILGLPSLAVVLG